MAAKQIDKGLAQDVVADWRTGDFNQREIAEKRRVSLGTVNKLCKGIAQDTADIVNAGVQYKTGLAGQDERNVNAIMAVVDERTKHIQFFTSVAITNVKEAMGEPCEGQAGYRMRADTILKARDTVLGKSPDTAVQINNVPSPSYYIPDDPVAAAAAYQRIMQGH